jgi:hypothetical protein
MSHGLSVIITVWAATAGAQIRDDFPRLSSLTCRSSHVVVIRLAGCRDKRLLYRVERSLGGRELKELELPEGVFGRSCRPEDIEYAKGDRQFAFVRVAKEGTKVLEAWSIFPDNRVSVQTIVDSPWPPRPALGDVVRTVEEMLRSCGKEKAPTTDGSADCPDGTAKGGEAGEGKPERSPGSSRKGPPRR